MVSKKSDTYFDFCTITAKDGPSKLNMTQSPKRIFIVIPDNGLLN